MGRDPQYELFALDVAASFGFHFADRNRVRQSGKRGPARPVCRRPIDAVSSTLSKARHNSKIFKVKNRRIFSAQKYLPTKRIVNIVFAATDGVLVSPAVAFQPDAVNNEDNMKLSDRAYLRFKDAMLSGEIEPGGVITQADLAKKLDVRIGPLRVAINKLQVEGLVDVLPRNGVRLIKPDFELIRNSFQLRTIIEREAVKVFANRVSNDEIEELCAKHEALLERVSNDGVIDEEFMMDAKYSDDNLHQRFVESLENPLVTKNYETNVDRIALIRRESRPRFSKEHYIKTCGEHLNILHAIRDRNLEEAVSALDTHLFLSMRREMGL